MFQVSPRVAAKQKCVIDMHRIQRRESKYTPMKNHQFKKEDGKRGRKKLQNNEHGHSKSLCINNYFQCI